MGIYITMAVSITVYWELNPTVKLWLAQFVFELNIEVPVKNAVQSCK